MTDEERKENRRIANKKYYQKTKDARKIKRDRKKVKNENI